MLQKMQLTLVFLLGILTFSFAAWGRSVPENPPFYGETMLARADRRSPKSFNQGENFSSSSRKIPKFTYQYLLACGHGQFERNKTSPLDLCLRTSL